MSKIKTEDVYFKIKEDLDLGIKNGRFYIREDNAWIELAEQELPVIIRGLYSEEERAGISSGMIKEASLRLIEDPDLQIDFFEEHCPSLVNLENGVYDSHSGKLEEKTEEESFGYELYFSYLDKEQRNSPVFERFIQTTFLTETSEKRRLLYEIMGYCISDYTCAKAGFFLIGESNSGKSTVLELIKMVMPEHTVTAIPLYRLENRFNLARLAGARINICTELSEKSFVAVDIYKILTSNETVTAEHKGQKPFEFQIRCKCLNAGNMLPDLDKLEGMAALLNRMVILMFPTEISKERQDKDLIWKLWEERDSIFSDALDALYELVENNFIFIEPMDTKKIKSQMSAKGNCFRDFIEERCSIEKNAREHFVTLYEQFQQYCQDNLFDVKLTRTQFSQKIVQLPGIERGKFRLDGRNPLYGAIGIRLKTKNEYSRQDSQGDSQTDTWISVGNESPWNNGTVEQGGEQNE